MPGRWEGRRSAQGDIPREEAPASTNNEVLPASSLKGDKEKAGHSEQAQGQCGCNYKDEEQWMRFWLIHP